MLAGLPNFVMNGNETNFKFNIKANDGFAETSCYFELTVFNNPPILKNRINAGSSIIVIFYIKLFLY